MHRRSLVFVARAPHSLIKSVRLHRKDMWILHAITTGLENFEEYNEALNGLKKDIEMAPSSREVSRPFSSSFEAPRTVSVLLGILPRRPSFQAVGKTLILS
jgi:hypothetical protein